MRYASYTDRRAMVTAMRPIYTAPTEGTAVLAMEDFRTQFYDAQRTDQALVEIQ